MHSSMAVVAWFQAMRLSLCIRGLMLNRMTVDARLQSMRLVPVYTRADAQAYGSRYMALGHAFSVCEYAG